VIWRDGRYWLYYSISSWGRNDSAIAVVSNATLDPTDPEFAWKDEGVAIRSLSADNFNAIDPAVLFDAEGRLWMVFGSFWSGIQLVELDRNTGRRLSDDSPIFRVAYSPQIEAPCIVRHRDRYVLFVNWGRCCRGVDSTYEIRVGRSRQITGPYLDRDGVEMQSEGGTLFLSTEGRFIGPGHAAVLTAGTNQWLSYHFYDGARRGAPTLGIRELEWDEAGWPLAGDSVTTTGRERPGE
jgi:arabinan endo-1,5-alpha-L-arabinosidase